MIVLSKQPPVHGPAPAARFASASFRVAPAMAEAKKGREKAYPG